MARPERFELPTTKFVAWYSIQLSYGREAVNYSGWAAGRQALLLTAIPDRAMQCRATANIHGVLHLRTRRFSPL
jgi:hypothetical protein